jgi:hypothetical protein
MKQAMLMVSPFWQKLSHYASFSISEDGLHNFAG